VIKFNDAKGIWVPNKIVNYLDNLEAAEFSCISPNTLKAKEQVLLYTSNMLKGYTSALKGDDNKVYLVSDIIEEYVGKNHTTIRDFLIKHSIINCSRSYRVDHYPMSYSFTPEYLAGGITYYPVSDKIIQNKVIKRKNKLLEEAKNNAIASYLINEVYPHLSLPTTDELLELGYKLAAAGVKTNKGKTITMKKDALDPKMESYVEDSLELFNHLTGDGYMIPVIGSEKSGYRIYDSFSLAPSWCRSLVRISGQPICEVDYSTFHPNLALAIYGGNNKKRITHDEVANYLGISRSEAKRLNLSFFNLKLQAFRNNPLFGYYQDNHPTVIKGLIYDKLDKRVNNTVSQKFLKLEVDIMTEVIRLVRERNIKAIYVYDALYVIQQHCHEVKEIMDRVAKQMGVNAMANANINGKY